MIGYILFLIVFKLINAPVWCFVIAWAGIIWSALVSLVKMYKLGKESGKRE